MMSLELVEGSDVGVSSVERMSNNVGGDAVVIVVVADVGVVGEVVGEWITQSWI